MSRCVKLVTISREELGDGISNGGWIRKIKQNITFAKDIVVVDFDTNLNYSLLLARSIDKRFSRSTKIDLPLLGGTIRITVLADEVVEFKLVSY